ncbi:MAG: type VI secretion system protein TssA [Caulobacteraceae bacterium]
MALDLETLLAPVSEESPAGADLAYDPARAEIDQAFDRPASIDATTGESVATADVDWRAIVRQIESQSQATKDLWLAVYLCRAGARMGDLDTVLMGAEFLAGLCEGYWESVHPALDEYGFQGRKGPCESLASIADFLGPLRGVRLVEHPRLGVFTGLDFERFRDGGEAQEGYDRFRAALGDTPDEVLTDAAAKLDAVAAAIRRVDQVLMAKADGGTGANFKATYDALANLKRAVLAFSTSPAAAATDAEPAGDAGPADAAPGAPATMGAGFSGRIDSREDVLRALDAIGDYYRRREPHSPVPLVIQRAREWINLDFLGVLADIAPNSLDEARRVLTYKKPDDYS